MLFLVTLSFFLPPPLWQDVFLDSAPGAAVGRLWRSRQSRARPHAVAQALPAPPHVDHVRAGHPDPGQPRRGGGGRGRGLGGPLAALARRGGLSARLGGLGGSVRAELAVLEAGCPLDFRRMRRLRRVQEPVSACARGSGREREREWGGCVFDEAKRRIENDSQGFFLWHRPRKWLQVRFRLSSRRAKCAPVSTRFGSRNSLTNPKALNYTANVPLSRRLARTLRGRENERDGSLSVAPFLFSLTKNSPTGQTQFWY